MITVLKTKMLPLLTVLFLILGSLTGCAKFRPFFQEIPNSQMNRGLAANFSLYAEQDDLSRPWWENFKSQGLTQLMERAVRENFSVQEAVFRVEQARFSAGIAGAPQHPTLNYGAGVSDLTQKVDGSPRTESDNWSLGLSAGYEVDLWGQVLADKNKALSVAKASKNDLHAAVMTVTGELASKWAALISTRQQQELFNKELSLQKKLLGLVKGRFPIGQSTALDIYQQQQAIEKIIESQVPLDAKESSLQRQITFLIGGEDSDEKVATILANQEDFPTISDIPKPGLPADLLAARPDIRAAGFRLQAEEWAIVAAKADRLPSLKLSASHDFASSSLTNIFNNWVFNLGASLAGPIFDGNKRALEVKRVQAVVQERLASYRKVVFSAVVEVEDALADEAQYARILESLNRQVLLSEKTMREARNRYLNGSTDFLNVLKEELNNLQLQQRLIITNENKTIARIDLYRALGGSWLGDTNNRTIE